MDTTTAHLQRTARTVSRPRQVGAQALPSALSAGSNKGQPVSRLARVFSSCQGSRRGAGRWRRRAWCRASRFNEAQDSHDAKRDAESRGGAPFARRVDRRGRAWHAADKVHRWYPPRSKPHRLRSVQRMTSRIDIRILCGCQFSTLPAEFLNGKGTNVHLPRGPDTSTAPPDSTLPPPPLPLFVPEPS